MNRTRLLARWSAAVSKRPSTGSQLNSGVAMNRTTAFATRKAATRVLRLACAVTLLAVAPLPTAAHAQVPPEPVATRVSSETGLAAQIAKLTQEGRQAPTLAIRRQIHNELTLVRLDSRWGDS